MNKSVAFIIANKNFRDEELFVTRDVLIRHDVNTAIIALSPEVAVGTKGGSVNVDFTLDQLHKNLSHYDAIVFVGGSGSSIYFNNNTAHDIAKQAYAAGKTVAAICIAPVTLENAGILTGKRVTSYPSEKEKFTSSIYTNADLEIDGKIITANGPQSSEKFGNAILKSLL